MIFSNQKIIGELYFKIENQEFTILHFLFSDDFLIDNFDENKKSNFYEILNEVFCIWHHFTNFQKLS